MVSRKQEPPLTAPMPCTLHGGQSSLIRERQIPIGANAALPVASIACGRDARHGSGDRGQAFLLQINGEQSLTTERDNDRHARGGRTRTRKRRLVRFLCCRRRRATIAEGREQPIQRTSSRMVQRNDCCPPSAHLRAVSGRAGAASKAGGPSPTTIDKKAVPTFFTVDLPRPVPPRFNGPCHANMKFRMPVRIIKHEAVLRQLRSPVPRWPAKRVLLLG